VAFICLAADDAKQEVSANAYETWTLLARGYVHYWKRRKKSL